MEVVNSAVDVNVLPGDISKRARLSMIYRNICFGLGGLPFQTTTNVLTFFLSIFLLEVAELPPLYNSIVLFTKQSWDALTDPIVGTLIPYTGSRFGQLKPWIALSTPAALVTYVFFWYVPDFPEHMKLVYYLVLLCLFQTFITCHHVPYTSLTMHIGNSQVDRDNATAFRMAFEILGVIMAVAIQGPIVKMHRTAGSSCNGTAPSRESIRLQDTSYLIAAGIVVVVYALCIVAVIVGVKERPDLRIKPSGSLITNVKKILTFRPYLFLMLGFLFNILGIQILTGNLILYYTYSLNIGDHFDYLTILSVVTSAGFVPLWQILSRMYGKANCLSGGILIFFPPLLLQLFYSPSVVPMYFIVFICGISISTVFLLPWTMLSDVVSLYTATHDDRQDVMFYAFFVFFNKIAAGLGLAVSQIVLGLAGYQVGACTQPSSVGATVRIYSLTVPALLFVIALICIYFYPDPSSRHFGQRSYNNRDRAQSHTVLLPGFVKSNSYTVPT